MGCLKSKEMKFRVWDIDSAGEAHETNREFSISLEESKRYDRNTQDIITLNAILWVFFVKMFSMTNNGFAIRPNFGAEKDYKSLTIKWHNDTWRLTRIF